MGVYQEAPREWLVTGDIRGHPIAVIDKTEQGAIEKWREKAQAYLVGGPIEAEPARKRTSASRTLNPRQSR